MSLSGRLAIFTIQSSRLFQNAFSSIGHFSNRICNQTRPISVSLSHHFSNSNLSPLQIKKRPIRKKRASSKDNYNVIAFATAEEYDIERLQSNIIKEDLYQIKDILTNDETNDFLCVTAKYQIDIEPREIFFFREGSIVLWNCSELECENVLKELSKFEIERYDRRLVQDESESMPFNYDENGNGHLKNGMFYLSSSDMTPLEKYTFSNALSTSVKLGIWEALLDRYVDSMAFITEDLKKGNRIKMSRADVLRKTGELFALRHSINLSSDLLDTPDFYWDRDKLEDLYLITCSYFSIQRRTKVMNEKLNHCVELAELISSNLNDNHHVRLEWMIIWLIVIEVLFEFLHLYDRHTNTPETAVDE